MDFLYGPDAEPEEPEKARSRSPLLNKLAIVGITGLAFTGAVFGLGSLASAQTTEPSTPAVAADGDAEGDAEEGVWAEELSEFDSFSPEDQALIEQFEQCITDSGIELGDEIELGEEVDEAELTEEDYDAIDEAFEKCETVLDDLSFDSELWLDGDDQLSEEDAAVFEAYDECLSELGILDLDEDGNGELALELSDEDIEGLEESFDACDQILDDLSEDFEMFEGDWDEADLIEDFDLSPEDEALFERFDECLIESGVFGEELSEDQTLSDEEYEAIDEAVEDCEAILEDLSDDVQFFFEDCPDDHDRDEGELEEPVEDTVNA